MGLDVNTLFLVTIYVEAMLGLLLLFAWIQNSGIHAVAWWGCAHLLRAALGHAVRHVRLGAGRDLDRPRQRDPVHGVRRDLDRRAGVRRPRRSSRSIWSAAPSSGCSSCRVPLIAGFARCARAARRPASSPPTPGSPPTNSGAAAASRWCRAGPRSSCCSRTARCSCCARRCRRCCRGRRPTRCSTACG